MYVCINVCVQVFAEIGSASVLSFAEQLLPVVRVGLGVGCVYLLSRETIVDCFQYLVV